MSPRESARWRAATPRRVSSPSTPSDSGGGTEVSGGSYARVGVATSLANFAGTQGATTTVASTGTSGATSNNALIEFPVPTGDWGRVTHIGVYDAPTSGNLLLFSALTNAKNINNGDPAPKWNPGAWTFQIDN